MKNKILKIIFTILLVISFIPLTTIFIGIINCFISGYGGYDLFGVTIPQTYGLTAVKNYLVFLFKISNLSLGIIIIPVSLICLIYQILYFKKLK